MNLDARIATKARPIYGCHSDLDRLTKREPFECDYDPREDEKACAGCERLETNEDMMRNEK